MLPATEINYRNLRKGGKLKLLQDGITTIGLYHLKHGNDNRDGHTDSLVLRLLLFHQRYDIDVSNYLLFTFSNSQTEQPVRAMTRWFPYQLSRL